MSVLFSMDYWSEFINFFSLFYNSPFEFYRPDDPMLHWILHYELSTTTIAHEYDNWVNGFFLLVPCEEKKAPILIQGDLMSAPSPYQQQQRHPFPIFDSSIHSDDCMTSGRELNHWDCAHGKSTRFPSGLDSCNIFSSIAWMDRYLLELCTLAGVHFA